MLIAFSLVLTSCSPFTRQETALLKLLNEILVLDPDTKSHEKLLRQMDLSSEEASGVDIRLTLLAHAFDGHWGYALFQLDTPVSTVPPDMSTIALGLEITYQIKGQPILLADFYDLPTAAALDLPGRPGGLHTSWAWKKPSEASPHTAYVLLQYRLYGPVHTVTLCASTVANTELSMDPKLFRAPAGSAKLPLTQTHQPRIAQSETAYACVPPLGVYLEFAAIRDPVTGENGPGSLPVLFSDGKTCFTQTDPDQSWQSAKTPDTLWADAYRHSFYGTFRNLAAHLPLPDHLTEKTLTAIYLPNQPPLVF